MEVLLTLPTPQKKVNNLFEVEGKLHMRGLVNGQYRSLLRKTHLSHQINITS